MRNASFALSELDVMENLLRRFVLAFNHHGDAGREAGMEAVSAELVSLGSRLKLHQGESANEVVANWLEEQNCRVPLK